MKAYNQTWENNECNLTQIKIFNLKSFRKKKRFLKEKFM